jgi:hypothetical protein
VDTILLRCKDCGFSLILYFKSLVNMYCALLLCIISVRVLQKMRGCRPLFSFNLEVCASRVFYFALHHLMLKDADGLVGGWVKEGKGSEKKRIDRRF